MPNPSTYTFTAVTPDYGRPFVVWSYGEGDDPEVLCEVEDAEFAEHIAKYDPEHTALIEAVVGSVGTLCDGCVYSDRGGDCTCKEDCSVQTIREHNIALASYRKERGLDE